MKLQAIEEVRAQIENKASASNFDLIVYNLIHIECINVNCAYVYLI